MLKDFLKDYGVLLTSSMTFLATLVALFKDWIISKIFSPKLNVYEDCGFIANETGIESDDAKKEIDNYTYEIKIKNCGKGICKDVQLYLESIQLKSENDAKFHNIDLENLSPLQNKSKSQIVNLPEFGRPISYELIRILNPNNTNSGVTCGDDRKAQLKIGNFFVPSDEIGGEYKIIFCVYSENAKMQKFFLNLNWKGVWENNKDKFLTNRVNISLEIIK